MATGLSRRGIFGALIGAATAASAVAISKPEAQYPDVVTVNGRTWTVNWTGWKKELASTFSVGQWIAEEKDTSHDIKVYSSFPGASGGYYSGHIFDVFLKAHQEELITSDFMRGDPDALEAGKKNAFDVLLKELECPTIYGYFDPVSGRF